MKDTSRDADELLISLDGQTFDPYTGPIQKNGVNGSVWAKVKDKAQNESLATQEVKFFYDADLPEAPHISFDQVHPEGYYNDSGIQVTFTDNSQDGILTYYRYGSNDFSNLRDTHIFPINEKNHLETIKAISDDIYAIVVDKAGNKSLVTGPKKITYDITPPSDPSLTIAPDLLHGTDNRYKEPLEVSIKSTSDKQVSLLCSFDKDWIPGQIGDDKTTPCEKTSIVHFTKIYVGKFL